MTTLTETLSTTRPHRAGRYSIRAGFAWDDEWIFGIVTRFTFVGLWYFVAGPFRLCVSWPFMVAGGRN